MRKLSDYPPYNFKTTSTKMAKKLRQTLPKEFTEFYYSCSSEYNHQWTDEDIQRFKEILEPCDANARERGGYRKAIHSPLMTF